MKPQIGCFSELLGPNLIINLAQLVSPSVALSAELVLNMCQCYNCRCEPCDPRFNKNTSEKYIPIWES